jgi:HK97 family phage major capsid protein
MATYEDMIAELTKEFRVAKDNISAADKARTDAITELRTELDKGSKSFTEVQAKLERIVADVAGNATKAQGLQDAIDSLTKKINRPGGDRVDDEKLRKSAMGLLEMRHHLKVPKVDPNFLFKPTEDQITESIEAIKATRQLLKVVGLDGLPDASRKALSSFAMGSSGFILPPEMSSEVLSCLTDITDITGLMRNMTISGPSIKFLVDDVRLMSAAWACETNCFANNPAADLLTGLGELEIKPETLRYIVCATRDLIEDASIDIENWMLQKVNWAFRNTISDAILNGDGMGKPLGILRPQSGIPICDTSNNTPAGQFTWQDLIMLKWQVPMQFQGPGRYLMNQNTFGLTLTMSDAMGRPIMIATPLDNGQFIINGSPVNIVTQMPDVAPGAVPVAYGNWNLVYMVVNRKAVTMQQDPYSAGFCILFKFEGRVGGATICPNAARLLRIG